MAYFLLVTLMVMGVEANLVVLSPMSLRKLFPMGEIKTSYANFGYIPYGHNMVSECRYKYHHDPFVCRSADSTSTKTKTLCAIRSHDKNLTSQ